MAGASSVVDDAPDALGAADAESEIGADTHVPFGKVLTEALTKRPGMLLEKRLNSVPELSQSHLYDSTMEQPRIPA